MGRPIHPEGRVRIVGCRVMERELIKLLEGVPYRYDLTLLEMRYHGSPGRLKTLIQSIIDSSSGYRFILLTYGLCGGITKGLMARGVSMVLPKVHDCIDLMLGSTERRQELILDCSGTYFLSNGWVEMDGTPAEKLKEYKRLLGEEELQAIKGLFYGNYRRSIFIRTGVEGGEVVERARASAIRMGWQHSEVDGDLSLLKRLLYMEWDKEHFIIL